MAYLDMEGLVHYDSKIKQVISDSVGTHANDSNAHSSILSNYATTESLNSAVDTLTNKVDEATTLVNDSVGSTVTEDSFKETMETELAILSSISKSSTDTLSFNSIKSIVKAGNASSIFSIGDQIIVPWVDDSGTTYQMPFDIVHFGDVEESDGDVKPGMFLQSHYALPVDIQFDNNEAMYYTKTAMDAGTYYLKITYGISSIKTDQYIVFTTTVQIPAKGHIVPIRGMWDKEVTDWRLYTYKDAKTTTALETITPILVEDEPTTGTFLGNWSRYITWENNDVSAFSSIDRSVYGYSSYKDSAYRQWLNSHNAANNWWVAQSKFDRISEQATSRRGFMAGFSDDFLSALGRVKVTTATETYTHASGTLDTTYDWFFLPSIKEEWVKYTDYLSTEGGEEWEYWKRTKGISTPQLVGGNYAMTENIRYSLSNRTSSVYCWYRSTSPWFAFSVFYVSPSGYVSYGYAYYSLRSCPACVIC